MPKLTAKQERYAMALASGTMSQSAAYRSAGYGGKSAPATIHAHASALAADGRVVARVQALRADMVAVATYDSQALMADLQRVARVAVEKEQLTAAVKALEAIGRIIGAFGRNEMLIRHSGRGAVQHESAPTTMTADRARGILGASKEQAPVP
jgi:hypothetical protein